MSTLQALNLKNPSSGSNNVVLNTDGTTTIASPSNIIKSGTAVASTSGTAIDFTSVPSWVKRITLMLNGVSTSGTASVMVRLGTGGTVASTGYVCATAGVAAGGNGAANYTTGFGTDAGAGLLVAASVRHGHITITNITGNVWVASGAIGFSNLPGSSQFGGTVTLSGTLDQVRLTTSGADTFDAGAVNILYEG